MNILLVEDEVNVASFIKQGLEEQNIKVDLAYDGQIGLKLATQNSYQVIVLDLIIPYINGIELCKKLREANIQSPILMLTALGTTDDKITGFDAGADDYLIKPFEFAELLARVRALSKRSTGLVQTSNQLKIENLTLDLDRKIATRDQHQIELTAKEFGLLEYLLRNKGKVVSRASIAEHVWDIDFDTGTNVVDVYVNILRKKIDKNFEPKLIHTRIGLGYILQAQ